jgi:large subunit ribosomal protein L30
MSNAKQLKLTLVKSPIHRAASYKSCVKGLGLLRMHHTVIVEDTSCNRGMINKVIDMLKIEEV